MLPEPSPRAERLDGTLIRWLVLGFTLPLLAAGAFLAWGPERFPQVTAKYSPVASLAFRAALGDSDAHVTLIQRVAYEGAFHGRLAPLVDLAMARGHYAERVFVHLAEYDPAAAPALERIALETTDAWNRSYALASMPPERVVALAPRFAADPSTDVQRSLGRGLANDAIARRAPLLPVWEAYPSPCLRVELVVVAQVYGAGAIPDADALAAAHARSDALGRCAAIEGRTLP